MGEIEVKCRLREVLGIRPPIRMLLAMLLMPFMGLFSAVSAQTEKPKSWVLSGYVKNLQSVYDLQGLDQLLLDNLIHNRINFRWYADDHLTVRIEARNRLFFGNLVSLNPNFSSQIEQANNDQIDLSVHWMDRPSALLNSTLDRAYVQYAKGKFEASLGRQRINWGINTVWNPNDIFNAFSFTDFDYEERPGSDAALVRYYLGTNSSLEAAVNLGDTWSSRVAALLFKWNMWQYDFQFLNGWANGDYVIGGGWAGNIKDAGFKGEWTSFLPAQDNQSSSHALSLAIDYVFAKGLYLNVGYLFNSNGQTEGTLQDLFAFELSAKNLYPFRHALLLQTSYPITPLINGSIAWIFSPGASRPLFVNPTLTISVAQNWDLDLVGQLSWNKEGSRYRSPFNAGFMRVKMSF